MTPTELLERFRSDMADEADPPLWTDDDIYSYMDSAQVMFCRFTDGLADSTSAVTQLSIVPDTEWYDVSQKILKIRKAVRRDTGLPVELATPETAADRFIRFDGAKGPFRTLVQGLEDFKLRAHPVPNDTVTVELQVLRLPLETISDSSMSFEVSEEHHENLMLWMKSRAYLKQDAETIDKNRSADFESAFRNYCREVKRELSRRRHSAGTTSYGGL